MQYVIFSFKNRDGMESQEPVKSRRILLPVQSQDLDFKFRML
jgi:hypothetical protein